MRDILFRGKRVDSGKWVQGYYVYDDSEQLTEKPRADIVRLHEHPCGFSMLPFEVIPETVGQYTGLTDKNGKKIFEGDIVNVNTNPEDSLCHSYKGKCLVIRFDEYHRFVASGRFEYPLCNHYEWEVIGNIHDNPELLKGGAE